MAGHLVSRLMNLWTSDAGWDFGFLHPVYDRLMISSVHVQGDGAGPWGSVVEEIPPQVLERIDEK